MGNESIIKTIYNCRPIGKSIKINGDVLCYLEKQ